jgi:hypothetical protein
MGGDIFRVLVSQELDKMAERLSGRLKPRAKGPSRRYVFGQMDL